MRAEVTYHYSPLFGIFSKLTIELIHLRQTPLSDVLVDIKVVRLGLARAAID